MVGLVRCVTVVCICARVGWLGSLGDRWCVSVLQLVGLVRCVTIGACLCFSWLVWFVV